VLDPIEPDDAAGPGDAVQAAPLSFQGLRQPDAATGADDGARLGAALLGLRALMLGYDVTPALARAYADESARVGPDGDTDPARWQGEQALVEIFTDLCALFRRQPGSDDPEAMLAVRAEEHLFTYLRTPDTQG
jgi:hypothetical protein